MNKIINNICNQIKRYFEVSGGKTAVIGISGGKDSTVCAALCAKALAKENVLGVLMPNGEQKDIEDSYKICQFLDIEYIVINIHDACYSIESAINYNIRIKKNPTVTKFNSISKQTEINLPPRIRMATLYAVAQSVDRGRVINTTNACEAFVGYGTLFGDTIGDFAILKNIMVSGVYEIGDYLKLPNNLVHKTPSDGLTGKSDEENLGVTYNDIEKYMNHKTEDMSAEKIKRIEELHNKSQFKRSIINIPHVVL